MKNLIPSRQMMAICTAALGFVLGPSLAAQSANDYLSTGRDRANLGDLDGAIAEYSKAIGLDAGNAVAFNCRGLAKCNQGNFEGAIADFTQVSRLKPGFAEAYYNRGTAEFLEGNLDGAIASNSTAIKLRPDHQGAYFHRALAESGETNFQGAFADFEKARQLQSGSGAAGTEYLGLHEALAARRMGHAVDEHLAAGVGTNDWKKALAQFLSNQLSEAALMSHAVMADAEEQKVRQQSEALYFSGVIRLLNGNKAGARANLKECVAISGPTSVVRRLAQTELDRM